MHNHLRNVRIAAQTCMYYAYRWGDSIYEFKYQKGYLLLMRHVWTGDYFLRAKRIWEYPCLDNSGAERHFLWGKFWDPDFIKLCVNLTIEVPHRDLAIEETMSGQLRKEIPGYYSLHRTSWRTFKEVYSPESADSYVLQFYNIVKSRDTRLYVFEMYDRPYYWRYMKTTSSYMYIDPDLANPLITLFSKGQYDEAMMLATL